MTVPQPNNPFCRIPGSRALLDKLIYKPQMDGGMDLEGHLSVFVGWTQKNLVFEGTTASYSYTPMRYLVGDKV